MIDCAPRSAMTSAAAAAQVCVSSGNDEKHRFQKCIRPYTIVEYRCALLLAKVRRTLREGRMRFGLVVVAAAALLVTAGAPASAGLVGSTVDASFWIPIAGLTTTSPPPDTCTTSLPCEVPNYPVSGGSQSSPPPTVPVDFLQGATSGSDRKSVV